MHYLAWNVLCTMHISFDSLIFIYSHTFVLTKSRVFLLSHCVTEYLITANVELADHGSLPSTSDVCHGRHPAIYEESPGCSIRHKWSFEMLAIKEVDSGYFGRDFGGQNFPLSIDASGKRIWRWVFLGKNISLPIVFMYRGLKRCYCQCQDLLA